MSLDTLNTGEKHSLKFNSACRLHWRYGNEEYVVYNAASGQTHLINELGAIALRLLQKHMLNIDELKRQIAEQSGLSLDSEFSTYIDEMLDEMERLGLINFGAE